MTLTNEALMQIIRDADTQIDFSKLDPDTPFDSANADSLDLMNILLGVQELLDIEIPDDEVDNLNTVNKILSYVN